MTFSRSRRAFAPTLALLVLFAAPLSSHAAITGTGSVGDPYVVTTCDDLQAIPNYVASSEYYRLAGGTIDCTATSGWNEGDGFNPIQAFAGHLDGNNTTINGLYIHRTGTDNIALFGTLAAGASIHDLTLTNVDITGNNQVGSLAGATLGSITINNVEVSGAVHAGYNAGGLIAYINTDGGDTISITNATTSVPISVGNWTAGGLVGGADIGYANNTFTVSHVHVMGSINAAYGDVGGLFGYLDVYDGSTALVANSSFGTEGTTITTGGDSVGGIIGYSDTEGTGTALTITDTRALFVQAGTSGYDQGGIIGHAYTSDQGQIEIGSGTSATVDIGTGHERVGGIVGYAETYSGSQVTLNGVHAEGAITTDLNQVGGLIGYLYAEDTSSAITGDSVVNIDISSGNQVGGVIGGYELYYGSSLTVQDLQAGSPDSDVYGHDSVGAIAGRGWSSHNSQVLFDNVTAEYRFGNTTSDLYDWGGAIGHLESYIGSDTTIRDSSITVHMDAPVSVTHIGGIAGYVYFEGSSTIAVDNSSVLGAIDTAGQQAGGMFGYLDLMNSSATVDNSYMQASVNGLYNVGGIFGQFYAEDRLATVTVRDTQVTGAISGSFDGYVGGIGGYINGDSSNDGSLIVDGAYVSSGITALDASYVGGFFGSIESSSLTVFDSTYYGSINVDSGSTIGGLAGYASFSSQERLTIDQVHLGSDAAELTTGSHVGGLFGELYLSTDGIAHTIADVTAEYTQLNIDAGGYQGGLIGYLEMDPGSLTISNARTTYTNTDVGNNYSVGGLIGEAALYGSAALTVKNSQTDGELNSNTSDLGGVFGYLWSTDLDNTVTIDGVVSRVDMPYVEQYGGGIIGEVYSNASPLVLAIKNSSASGTYGDAADLSRIPYGYMGGLIGVLNGTGTTLTIDRSHSSTNIYSEGNYVGGLIGATVPDNTATITRSYATGELVSSGNSIGGLVGYVDGTINISESFTTGAVTGHNEVGGIIGSGTDTLTLSNVYSTGAIEGSVSVGGILGASSGLVLTQGYASGSVTSSGSAEVDAGGLIGYVESGSLSHSFSAAAVTLTGGEPTFAAGLIGRYLSGSFTLTDNTYDVDRSGMPHCAEYLGDGESTYDDVENCGPVNSEGAAPNYFFNNATNPPLDSWDVTDIWTLTSTYPVLRLAPFMITTSVGSHGSISPNGALAAAGSNQTFDITADAGYHVNDIYIDHESIGETGDIVFEDVLMNHTLHVLFTPDTAGTHTISATANTGGTISPSGSTEVDDGDDQTYTISASSGYSLIDVVVDGTSVGAVTSYIFSNVSADHTIRAIFATSGTTDRSIAASAGTGGTISPSGFVTVANHGSQSFTATAASGYRLKQLRVDGSIVAGSSYTFSNVTANHTILAEFERRTGSSGGGSSRAATPAAASSTPSTSVGTPPDAGASFRFVGTHTVGSTGPEVRELQRYLNSHGYTVATSGPGSAGQETETFGPATRAALARFQAANGISPALGYFGPLTRDTINRLLGGAPTPSAPAAPTTPVAAPVRDLTLGMEGADVSTLQEKLSALDLGPRARALKAHGLTGYFGPLTADAVREFQQAKGIVPISGYVGALTRAALAGL